MEETLSLGCSSKEVDSGAPDVTAVRGGEVRLYGHTEGVSLGANGTATVTSDENLKDLFAIDERYERFFLELKPILYTYKVNGHRKHIGYGARAVEQALENCGLTTEEFAGIVKRKNVFIPADENGTNEDAFYNELYSLRYEEFGALYAHMLQKALKRIDALEKRIETLEKGTD